MMLCTSKYHQVEDYFEVLYIKKNLNKSVRKAKILSHISPFIIVRIWTNKFSMFSSAYCNLFIILSVLSKISVRFIFFTCFIIFPSETLIFIKKNYFGLLYKLFLRITNFIFVAFFSYIKTDTYTYKLVTPNIHPSSEFSGVSEVNVSAGSFNLISKVSCDFVWVW